MDTEEKVLYRIGIDFTDQLEENAILVIDAVFSVLEDNVDFVEFHNPLTTIEDLEELGVAPSFNGSPLESYLEFVSNGNLLLDPVIFKYGLPRELGYTFIYEGIHWLTPTLVYKYSFSTVFERIRNADLFYLKTPGDPKLNPFSPHFFTNGNDEVPLFWIDNGNVYLYISPHEKVELDSLLPDHVSEVDELNDFVSSPEVEIHYIDIGVNN